MRLRLRRTDACPKDGAGPVLAAHLRAIGRLLRRHVAAACTRDAARPFGARLRALTGGVFGRDATPLDRLAPARACAKGRPRAAVLVRGGHASAIPRSTAPEHLALRVPSPAARQRLGLADARAFVHEAPPSALARLALRAIGVRIRHTGVVIHLVVALSGLLAGGRTPTRSVPFAHAAPGVGDALIVVFASLRGLAVGVAERDAPLGPGLAAPSLGARLATATAWPVWRAARGEQWRE